MDEIKAAAMRIAEKGNECCYHMDGYEEDLSAFAEKEIRSLLSNKHTIATAEYGKAPWDIPEVREELPTQNPVCRKCNGEGFIKGMMSGDYIKCDH